MKIERVLGALVFAVAASGCASIIRGTKQDFTVETTPPGAQAALSTGETCAATPCTLRRPRKEGFTVTLSMPGYQTSTHTIDHHWTRNGIVTGMVGNALIGGLIGVGVDAANGANQDLIPNPLAVTLEPVAAPAAEAAPADAAAPAQEQAAPG